MSTGDRKKANASNIAKSLLHSFPNLKQFFDISLNGILIETLTVGKTYQYPNGIIKYKQYSNYGIFMDYFIRKHLANRYKIVLKDEASELVLKRPDIYFTGNKKSSYYDIVKHYEIYKDFKTQAMEIVKSIKIVSLAYTLTFHDPLPKSEIESDDKILLEVIKYFNSLPYKSVEMKANVDCEYFEGNCDLIFNGEVLYEIKTSKYKSLARDKEKISIENFYKLILYGFGYYKKTGKIIKTFKIYNPLLGYEYRITVGNINMKLLEDCLKKEFIKPK